MIDVVNVTSAGSMQQRLDRLKKYEYNDNVNENIDMLKCVTLTRQHNLLYYSATVSRTEVILVSGIRR